MVVFLNKVDMVDDPETPGTGRAGNPRAASRAISTATTFRSSGSRLWPPGKIERQDRQIRHSELMAAVDEWIPQPERPVDKPFLMPIEDVFSIRAAAPWSPAASKPAS